MRITSKKLPKSDQEYREEGISKNEVMHQKPKKTEKSFQVENTCVACAIVSINLAIYFILAALDAFDGASSVMGTELALMPYLWIALNLIGLVVIAYSKIQGGKEKKEENKGILPITIKQYKPWQKLY